MNLPQNMEPVKAPVQTGDETPATTPAPALVVVQGAGAQARVQRLEEHLAASGLLPDDVPGWSVLRGKEAKAACEADIRGEVVAIPYLDLKGEPLRVSGAPFVRLRLLDSLDQTALKAKYLQRKATGAHIYVPRGFGQLVAAMDRANPPPLVVTEGEKKAEAGCKHLGGIPVLGIGGVSMWGAPDSAGKKAGKGPREVHPELAEAIAAYRAVAGEQARVVVLFDSEGRLLEEGEQSSRGDTVRYRGVHRGVEKRAVAEEAIALAAALRRIGLRASPAWCPATDDAKVGLDDWVQASTGAVVADALRGIECTTHKEEDLAVVAETARHFPLTPLGVSIGGEELVFHTRGEDDELVRLPVKDISHARIAALLGVGYVGVRYMRLTDNACVFDKTTAVDELVGLCEAAGRWHDVQTRGPGVWMVDGRVLVSALEGLHDTSTGTTVRGADRLVRPSERNRYGIAPTPLYFRKVRFHKELPWVSMQPLDIVPKTDPSPADDLLRWLGRWSYTSPSSVKALAGWLAYSPVGQALPRRPGVWVHGQAGSGKTTLGNQLRHLLHGGALFCAKGAASYTAVGLRQATKDIAMPVILDEAEQPTGASALTRTGQKASDTIGASLEAFRAGYSSTSGSEAGAVLSSAIGTTSGEAKVTESNVVWAWLSISPPSELRESDRERMVLVGLTPASTLSGPEPDEEAAGRLGERVRAWSIRHVHDMRAAVDWVRNSPEAQAVVPKARSRDTWGTLAAALGVLRHGSDWADNTQYILDAMREIADDQSTSGDGQGMRPAYERLFADILVAQTVLETEDADGRQVRKTRTVGELLALAVPTAPRRKPDAYQEHLTRLGIKKLASDKVFVAGSLVPMRDLARKAGHFGVDIDVVLAQHPQAERAGKGKTYERQVVGGGVKVSGVVLPIPAEVQELVDTAGG